MTRWVKWYVGVVGFDRLSEAMEYVGIMGGSISLVYADVDRCVNRKPDEPKGKRERKPTRTQEESQREIEDQLQTAMIEAGFTSEQAEQAMMIAREKRELRGRKVA